MQMHMHTACRAHRCLFLILDYKIVINRDEYSQFKVNKLWKQMLLITKAEHLNNAIIFKTDIGELFDISYKYPVLRTVHFITEHCLL